MEKLSEKTFHKIVHQVVGRLDLKIFDKELSKRDRHTFDETLILWVSIIFENTSLSELTRKQLYFDLCRLLKPIEQYDLVVFFDFLKVVDDRLRDHSNNTSDAITHRLSIPHRRLYGGIKPHIQDYVDSWYTSKSISCFRHLHTVFSYPTRITFRDVEGLQDQALAAYKQFEHDFEDREPDAWMVDRIATLFPIKERMDWMSDIIPQHGPGSVAEGTTDLIEKYKALRPSAHISYLYRNTDRSALEYASQPWAKTEKLARRAKVVFVPKSATKLRTICMEPATLMYHEQPVARKIVEQIRQSSGPSGLARRINLQDQSQNRELAWSGSLTGELSTIDLSNASDSVGFSFCKKLFRKSSLLPIVYALRSIDAELPDGDVIPLKKFAPMGSALCFPVECLVFAMIAEYTIVANGRRIEDSQYSIYGDDIIIETELAEALISNLRRFGFEPNVSKSYYSQSWFTYRESCGGEYIDGHDVTPLKIGRNFKGLRHSHYDASQVLPAAIDAANRLRLYGYDLARKYILCKLPKSILYATVPGTLFIQSKNSVNYSTNWDVNTQQEFVEGSGIKGDSYQVSRGSIEEEIAYFHLQDVFCRREPERFYSGELIPLDEPFDGHAIAKRGAKMKKRKFFLPSLADPDSRGLFGSPF